MTYTDTEHYMQFHGEPGVRLDREDSALNKSIERPLSLVFKLITPLLFYLPNVYTRDLDRVYIDDSIRLMQWKNFIGVVKRDWEALRIPVSTSLESSLRAHFILC